MSRETWPDEGDKNMKSFKRWPMLIEDITSLVSWKFLGWLLKMWMP